jgi:hypothetical protein
MAMYRCSGTGCGAGCGQQCILVLTGLTADYDKPYVCVYGFGEMNIVGGKLLPTVEWVNVE